MILFVRKEKMKIPKVGRRFTLCFMNNKACIRVTYIILNTETTDNFFIYPNDQHLKFLFAIADLNVTIPKELEHPGLETSYPSIADLST